MVAKRMVNGVALEAAAGITIVKGYFGRKSRRCVKGFGICKVKVFPKVEEDLVELERQIATPHEDFFAAFIIHDPQSMMEVRFLEPIPHLESDFHVDEGYPGVERMLREVCGYQQILPTLGRYEAQRTPDAPYGVVTLDVLRGSPLTEE